jgi:YjjG family noncanonical pyrimidine nucleotidase
MKYKCLLFDADGTLFDYDNAEFTALKTAFDEFGKKCSAACHLKYNQINNALFKDLEKGLITSSELRIKRFEILFSEFDISLDPEAFSRKYLICLSENTTLLPGALDTVRALHEKFKMFIVTNGIGGVQRPRFNRSDIRPYFIDILISDEIGVAKPAREYFDVIFKMMGDPNTDEVLIIGDSLTSDMTGGINYGIDTCWFNPSRKRNENNLEVTYEIDMLEQILEIVNPN